MSDKIQGIIDVGKKKKNHRAGWIVVDESNIIENGYIETQDGLITGVYQGSPREKCIDHGPGVLMPPFVNTHVHLELSALKDILPFDRGFREWVKALLLKRDAMGRDELADKARKAAQEMMETGNLYIGDISTLGLAFPIVKAAGLNGVCFHEYLGSQIASYVTKPSDAIACSLAGHAPHTTSPELLQILKKQSGSNGLPFSIHVAESDDESIFIHDKKGEWADFLASRGIDFSCWNIGSKTPVEYIHDMGILDPLTIAVHVLNTTDEDMDILVRSKSKVCVCPRSNKNLHGKLPDIEKLIARGLYPALGTDSLASCESLDIFDEMTFVNHHYPALDPAIIFSMGTINGAIALGLDHITGRLSKGRKATFSYRPVSINKKKNLFQGILSNDQ